MKKRKRKGGPIPAKPIPAKLPADSPKRTVPTAELAKACQVSRQSVQAWIRAGLPRDRRQVDGVWKSFFDPAEVAAWLRAQGSEKVVAGADPPMTSGGAARVSPPGASGASGPPAAASAAPGMPTTIGDAKLELILANLAYRQAKTEREQLDLAVRRGELIDRATVERDEIRKIVAVRSGLLALGASISERAAMREAAEVQWIVDQEVRRLLHAFAGTSDDGGPCLGYPPRDADAGAVKHTGDRGDGDGKAGGSNGK